MIKTKPSTILIILSTIFLIIYFSINLINDNAKPSKIIINNKIIDIEIANTEEKRTKGLSLHKPLKENEGMLFIFAQPGFYGFWMKDMLFDLDFIWIQDEKIVDLTENVSHNNQEKIYQPKVPVTQVLEVNSGFVKKNGVKMGDEVRIK